MNAGPIEHFEHWDIHNEGTQPAIRRVTDALDAERVAVREALGYGPPHFPWPTTMTTAARNGCTGRRRTIGWWSSRWRERLDLTRHRYMREDVAIGLAFLVSVARWVDVPAPVASGLLALAGAVNGEVFSATGRTLGNLGLVWLGRPADPAERASDAARCTGWCRTHGTRAGACCLGQLAGRSAGCETAGQCCCDHPAFGGP